MIDFFTENKFQIDQPKLHREWLEKVVLSENKKVGELSFIFCDDEYVRKINVEFLDHDTFTDIITFDETLGNLLGGDIFISTDRVAENALNFEVSFQEELRRVLSHGILHLAGYTDKTEEESQIMREKEEEKMKLFHVEQSK